jgi:hypothetical protein
MANCCPVPAESYNSAYHNYCSPDLLFITPPSLPCIHPQLTVVIRIRFDLWEFGDHQFRIETRDLEGEAYIAPIGGTLSVKGIGNASAVSHIVFTLGNIRCKTAGMLSFVLYVDDKEIASIPLYIRKP